MRIVALAVVLAASTLSTGLALATPPTPPPAAEAPAAHPPTPPNPSRTIRPSLAVPKAPTVDAKTAEHATAFETAKADPAKPIPASLRIGRVGRNASEAVASRDHSIASKRTEMQAEARAIESKGDELANPKRWDAYNVQATPSPENLAEASAAYVSAARLMVKKSGEFNASVARENPDGAAKVAAAKEMAADLRKGAALYKKSADAEDRRATAMRRDDQDAASEAASDKAHNTRAVALRLERQADEIERGGVPGAPLPAAISLK